MLHCAMVLIHIGTLVFCFFLIPASLDRLNDGGVGTMIVAVCQGGEFLGRWAIFYLGDRWGKYVDSSQCWQIQRHWLMTWALVSIL